MGPLSDVADQMPYNGHPTWQVRFTSLGEHPGKRDWAGESKKRKTKGSTDKMVLSD